jgi:hypothetical protein
VWGTIRDAATDSALTGATATLGWYGLRQGIVKSLQVSERRRSVTTDNAGVFFACGLPTDLMIATDAIATNSASGHVEYTIGARRLYRLDLLVSSDMVIPDSVPLRTAQDSLAAERAHGRSVVTGTVLDEKRNPVANATVTVMSADTSANTDASGKFQLSALPAGTHMVQVRHVGMMPVTQRLQLRPDHPTDVTIQMSAVTALATIDVRARSAQRMEYDDRRERGLGFALDSTVLNHRLDLFGALSNIPMTQVVRSDTGASIIVRNLSTRGTCTPTAFLDGKQTVLELIVTLPPDHFRAIEVLPYESVPIQYLSVTRCGVILFWSKNAKW